MILNHYRKIYSKPVLYPEIKMIVCDMAGTVINENGIIYDTIYNCLLDKQLDVSKNDIPRWYGMKKEEVIKDIVHKNFYRNDLANKLSNDIHKDLIKKLEEQYFTSSKITLIHPTLPEYLTKLRQNNIKVTLNTGYPSVIQKQLIDKFNMKEYIDDFISSDEVKYGRPYPYMIHKLMERNEIKNVKAVAKIGDTFNDIDEGRNAGCGQILSVLSGITRNFYNAKTDFVVNNIVDIKY